MQINQLPSASSLNLQDKFAVDATDGVTKSITASTLVALTRTNSYGAPLVANTATAMTDTSKVYVYTGNETGYTNGDWYYYNGTAWVSGGAYNSVAVSTDTTLTLSGVAADARAVGDRISAVDTALSTTIAGVQEDVQDVFQDLATEYSDLSWPVSAGQYCLYYGEIYKATQDIPTIESWNFSHWELTNLGEGLSDLSDVQGDIATLNAAIVTERLARQTADTSLNNAISAEATAREQAIAAEASAREAADNTLSASITAEQSAREAAITAEATAREAADNELKSAVFEFMPLTWEKGGLSLTDGQPTQDGSEIRSRVIDYLDTSAIVSISNHTESTLWMLFYSKSGNDYTFANAINVDAGAEWDMSQNHDRYMRLDFRSSVADAVGVSVLANSVATQLRNMDMSNVVGRVGDMDGIMLLSVGDFFRGNISVSNGTATYANYSKRVATRKGVTFPLVRGDEIYLNNYTDARFYPFYEANGTWYSTGVWITGGKFTVNTAGNYAIIMSNLTEKDQTGIDDLAMRLVIRKNSLKLYVDELLPVIDAAKKPKNATPDGYLQQFKPLVLLHFSDVHGDAVETDRINSVYQRVVNKCDDVICTGDMVASRFSDDASFIVNKGFLLTIGNHDALADTSGWDWSQMATQEQLYNKFFAPGIASWGVTYTQNITYYYKDYINSQIRLIVLTNFLTSEEMETQKTWLTATLDDARTKNLAVVIAMHYRPGDTQKKNSNFTKLDSNPSNNTSGGAITYRVSQFVAAGGEFIGYICGHEHSDYLLESTIYQDQIAVCIDAASVSQSNTYSDLSRDYGDHTQDLYNVFVADRSTKTIKVIRVGCDVDNYIRSRKTLSIKYDTKEIITQG